MAALVFAKQKQTMFVIFLLPFVIKFFWDQLHLFFIRFAQLKMRLLVHNPVFVAIKWLKVLNNAIMAKQKAVNLA